jgi:uncharacterized repeat protein (TIGR01451 family)
LDIFEGNYDQDNKVWLNNGEGVFSDSGQSLGNSYTEAIALGDVDGDGDLDAFLGNWAHMNTVWLNQDRLVVSKAGPAAALASAPITYTLTITNNYTLTATNLVITDTIPAGASYITGGTRSGNVVSWTIPSLASGEAISVTFVVTAATTITNSDYAVVADDGISAIGQVPVTTLIISRTWRLITTTVSLPTVGEHAMTYDNARHRVVLHGGNAEGWPYENTTWEFDGTDWLTITTTTSPQARYGAGLAYLATGEGLLLFGGSDESDTAFNQTWVYTDATWTQLAATGPASRTYHSLAANPTTGAIYLFGGNDGETYFNDLWCYENGVWTDITPVTRPISRTLAAMTYGSSPLVGGTEGGLFLFGGRTLTGTVLADLWVFDLTSETWQELPNGGGGGPPGRMAHSLTYDPVTSDVVLAGGTSDNGDTLLGETWHYQNGSWTQADPATPLPPRAYHQAVFDGNTIILFSNGEVWKYE